MLTLTHIMHVLKFAFLYFLETQYISIFQKLHETMHNSCLLSYPKFLREARKTIQFVETSQNQLYAILLLKDHPFEAKISIDMVLSTRHPSVM
jgi:hypothetical protein